RLSQLNRDGTVHRAQLEIFDPHVSLRGRLAERLEYLLLVGIEVRTVAMQTVEREPAQIVAFKNRDRDSRRDAGVDELGFHGLPEIADTHASALGCQEANQVVLPFEIGVTVPPKRGNERITRAI